MRAVTIPQPQASLIAADVVPSSTLSWMAPEKHWGTRIGLHAAKREVRHGYGGVGGDVKLGSKLYAAAKNLPEFDDFKAEIAPDDFTCHAGFLNAFLPLGAVIATATLVGCAQVEMHDDAGNAVIKTSQRSIAYIEDDGLDDYSIGRWVWLLSDVKKLPEPIPARGYQGLWTWQVP